MLRKSIGQLVISLCALMLPFSAVAANDDYMSAELRQQVENLKQALKKNPVTVTIIVIGQTLHGNG